MGDSYMDLLWYGVGLVGSLVELLMKCLEPFFFRMVESYDKYVYNPLQTTLSPIVQRIPREVKVGEKTVTVFTANLVSCVRTALLIPIACCLKYQLNWVACLLVVLHDFLDHLDGIVAKVQRRLYGNVDDPLLGGFMDAFCDKIVNVLCLWSLLMVTDFSHMTWLQTLLYLTPCVSIIGLEFTLGVVRVQDYFFCHYMRELKKSDELQQVQATAAIMEGKLKEKLESMGIAFLCVAQSSSDLMTSISGMGGVICLSLSIRLAHVSLSRKLLARVERKPVTEHVAGTTVGSNLHRLMTRRSVSVQVDLPDTDRISKQRSLSSSGVEKYLLDQHATFTRSMSLGVIGTLVDKVYTVGCFDLFHKGHIRLLQRMRNLGKQVIVGVHDSRSIYLLKKRVPVDSTEKRMLNVKQYADVVFCIAGTDPSNFIACMFWGSGHQSSLYVRGDDMPDFPARELCEKLMPITFVPYTTGVSSSKLRKDIYNSNQSDPRLDLDVNLFY